MRTKYQAMLTLIVAGGALAGCGGGSSQDSPAAGASMLAQQASAALPACNAAWDATTAYNGGAVVSYAGINYVANWWTQGNNPSTSNGATGSGQPWSVVAACDTGSTTPPPPTPPAGITSGSVYTLVNPASGKALDVRSAGTANGTLIDIYTQNGSVAQQWQIIANANGTYSLVNPNSGKYLDVVAAGTANGTAVDIYDGNGTAAQQWQIGLNTDGSYTLVNPNSGKSLDVSGAGTADGTAVDIYASNGTGAQKWLAAPVAAATPPASGFIYSPYFYSGDYSGSQLNTSVTGTSQTLLNAMPAKLSAVTWAFAGGSCGSENWNGVSASAFAAANVASFVSAGKKYIVSTGGAGTSFTCASDLDFTRFIQTYYSANLLGIDFDIENGQSQADIDNLVARVVAAQASYASLRYSFTLATDGGNESQSLGTTGVMVMNSIRNHGLKNYTINLMTMDYTGSGRQNASVCTLNGSGKCDMGQSAISAAKSLHNYWGVPYAQIELTPMIGGNDSFDEVFTLADAATISSFALANKLGGIHFWSFSRDRDCAPSTSDNTSSGTCNNYGKAGTLGYTNAFISALGL
ncbi:MAG TPA: RICIN domain-containing protein [Janthinobacterium sp.]|nr:RICIN domain-containing protein [Janthinobacterium sp.]